MRRLARCVSQLVLVAPLVALILSGCATTEPGTVTYPEGHYKMYGDGINTPYYWVWIPNGVSEASVPAPPPIPTRAAVVTAPTVVTTTPVPTAPSTAVVTTVPTVVTTTPVPTVPTVVTTTPVPTVPTVVTTTPVPTVPSTAVVTTAPVVTASASTVVEPNGRYQLYGDGVNIPYYWVWIPAGTSPPVPPPPPPR